MAETNTSGNRHDEVECPLCHEGVEDCGLCHGTGVVEASTAHQVLEDIGESEEE